MTFLSFLNISVFKMLHQFVAQLLLLVMTMTHGFQKAYGHPLALVCLPPLQNASKKQFCFYLLTKDKWDGSFECV